jgi:uncharacterized protein
MPLQSLLNSDYTVLSNGKSLSVEVFSGLSSITVEQDRNLPGLFQLEFSGVDLKTVLSQLSPGAEVEIKFEIDNQSPISVIKGEVLGLEPHFSSDRSLQVTVWGCDFLHRLQRSTKTRTFVKMRDSEIVRTIAKEAGLELQGTDIGIKHEYVMQSNQTDLQFLQYRAHQIGYELLLDGKQLRFQPILQNPGFLQQLNLGMNLLEFHPRFSLVSQSAQVTVKGWDVQQKQGITQTSQTVKLDALRADVQGEVLTNRFLGVETVISDRPVTIDTAKQIAQAQLDQTALDLVTAEGSCLGNPELRPGSLVLIKSLNQPESHYSFKGKYYVTGVTHRFNSDEGYVTDFRAKRNVL